MAQEKLVIRDIVRKVKRPPEPRRERPDSKKIKEKKKPLASLNLRPYVKISALVLIGLIFLLSVNALASVKIKITPAQEFIQVDTTLKGSAKKEDNPLILSLEFIKLEEAESRVLKAAGLKEVEAKAKGEIAVFNSFSSKPQVLVKNTRFETPDGKIYRIEEAVTVPGAKIENGKITPSSITAAVLADKPGEEYNIGLTDFTIPGFKETAKYEKFYGRSKTPMAGGFKGKKPVVSLQDVEKVRSELRQILTDNLFKKAEAKTPENFLFFRPLSEVSFSEKETLIAEAAEYSLKGTLELALLSKPALEKALAAVYLGKEEPGRIKIINLHELSFELLEKNFKEGQMTFRVKGRGHFVWLTDEEKLKEELVLGRKDYQKVFQNYPSIKKAVVVFKPSWWRTFPQRASKIKIEEVL